jgi:hypothetical protein
LWTNPENLLVKIEAAKNLIARVLGTMKTILR